MGSSSRIGNVVVVRSCGLALAALVAFAAPAAAQLNQDIDLTKTAGMVLQAQGDYRWGGFPVGPSNLVVSGSNVNFARCGCLLTSLSTAVELLVRGTGVPWWLHDQFSPSGGFTAAFSFSPKYINDYLNVGPNLDATRSPGWGFANGGGTTCGTEVWPWAVDGLAAAGTFNYGGVSWLPVPWTASSRGDVDAGLLKGYPSIIIREFDLPDNKKGHHANLIVGWDNTQKKYLIYDPMWRPYGLGANGVRVMGDGFPDAANLDEGYSLFQKQISAVLPIEPRWADRSKWLAVFDDPEPIQLRLTDPRGRRTGYDPLTGARVQENRAAFYSEFTSFTDPLGLLPEAPPFRYLAARDPEPGVYGLEVFGTGDGRYTLTLATVDIDQKQDIALVSGSISAGETKRYEITRSAGGAVSIGAVAAFGPHAKAGNDASTYVGTALSFDGRGSYQFNGTIATYAWTFGDGATGSGAQQTHTYAAPGSYVATLTVTNAAGLANSDDRTVLVAPASSGGTLKETIRVNVTDTGVEANAGSMGSPQVTPDGRYVVFESWASNLVPNDTNGQGDVFVKDLSTGAIERVSVATDGTQANSASMAPSISANGRFVTFGSFATNLGATRSSLYVHDRTMGTTTVVAPSGNFSELASLSADGRYVAFMGTQQLLPPAGYGEDIYVRDLQTGTVEIISTYRAHDPHISADGRFVTYWAAYGPDGLDTNGDRAGVYVRDRQTGTDELISRSAAGTQIYNHSFNPSISADGRYVAFEVNALSSDLNVGHPTARPDVFLRDRLLGTTVQVNTGFADTGAAFQPTIGPSGRYVAFLSAPTLELSSVVQMYLCDWAAGTTEMVSVATDGTPSAFGVGMQTGFLGPAVTSDGSVVFVNNDPNLVADDTNGTSDIFIRRYVAGSGGGEPSPPVANLGGPYTGWASSAAVPAAIRLDGSGSIDPAGGTLTALWDFGDGTAPTTAPLVTTHAYAQAGIYQVTLTVSAAATGATTLGVGGGLTSEPVHTEVEVLPALPAASLSVSACTASGGTLALDGAAPAANAALIASGWDTSTGPLSPAAVAVTLPWGSFNLATSLPGLTFSRAFDVPAGQVGGGYAAAVSGATAPFTVNCPPPANRAPLAVAGGPTYTGRASVPVTLDGSASSDPEGAPLTYRWDFGDGTTGTGVRPAHAYAAAGTFFVTLIVNDGAQDSATMVGTRSFAEVVTTGAPAVEIFPFQGFFAPVDNLPLLNGNYAGTVIPLTFSLGGDRGLNVFAAGYPTSEPVACPSGTDVKSLASSWRNPPQAPAPTSPTPSLTYDAGSRIYQYAWQTDAAWTGTCREFVMQLTDGTFHRLVFRFK